MAVTSSCVGEGSAATARIPNKGTLLMHHVYNRYRTRGRLHMDYIWTLVLDVDKYSILLMGKLRPRETAVVQVSDLRLG